MICPVCYNRKRSKPLRPYICKTNNFLCGKCGLVFIPRDSDPVRKYYKQNGYFKKSLNIAYKRQFISKRLLVKEAGERITSALEILPVILKRKSVLDVGCGYGEMLYSLKINYNCAVTGIEASKEAARHGSKIFSVSIYPLLLEEFTAKRKYDVICCSHVLEHVSNPRVFLKKISTLLKNKGYLYIEVPNILKPSGGFSLEMFLYSEHLQTFSAHNLYLLLKKNGFATIAYSDSSFLKFWCRISGKEGVKVPAITSGEILSFLRTYDSEYSVLDSIKVYTQKMRYAAKIAFYKLYDLSWQFGR